MRLLSVSGGAILAVAISLVGGALIHPLDTAPANDATVAQHDDVPHIVLQAMSWWYFNAQVSHSQLPANPAAHYVIIDLRQPEDFARGHLPGAVNVPADQIVAQLGGVAPDHDQSILLYGYDETHSVRSLAALRLLAYTRVVHLKDGWPGNDASPGINAQFRNHSATTS